MDVNYELYKVFYYVASPLSFSGSFPSSCLSRSRLSASRSRHWRKSWIRPYSSEAPRKYVLLPKERFFCAISNRRSAWSSVGKASFSMSAYAEDSFTSEPVIRSAVISWCLIWNASTGNFRERISRLRCDIDPLRRTSWRPGRWICRCQFTEFLSRKCSECEKDQRFPGCVHCQWSI